MMKARGSVFNELKKLDKGAKRELAEKLLAEVGGHS